MMRRVCLQGLIVFLAAPLQGRGGDVDLFEGNGVELKADLQRLEVEEAAGALEVQALEIIEHDFVVQADFAIPLPVFFANALEAKAEPEDRKLSGDEEKQVQEFLEKAGAARRKQFEKGLEELVDALAKEAKLDAAARRKIDALGALAIDEAVTEWEGKCREWMMPMILQSDEAAGVINNWQPEQIAANHQLISTTAPEETKAWRDGLKQILTAEQWAAREEKEKAKMEKLRKEFADYLQASEAQAGTVMASGMDTLLARIDQHGGIDEERRGKLKKAADAAVKATLADWRVRAEKQLLKMDQATRDQMAQQNGLMGVNANEKANQPREQPEWKEAFAQILTDAERAQLEERQRSNRARRAEALGMVLVADLDRLIGLGEKQRAGLLELVTTPLLGLPSHYFESPEHQSYHSIDMAQMLRQIRGIKDEQLTGLLDATQMKRWKEVTPGQLSRNHGYISQRMNPGELPAAEEMDEVEVERVLSAFLHKEARKLKLKMQAVMESQVENIRRVANPAPEAVTVLLTAAKGAAEEMAQGSINNLTGWMRGQIQTLKPSEVPARLQNLNYPHFSERQAPPEPRLWTAAVERMLTGPQREAWKTECGAREAWRLKGVAAIVLTEFEKRLPLKPAQRDALQKKLLEVIRDYEPAITNYFSAGWYLQGYYTLVPFAIPTDKEMEEFFDKKELETVKEKCLGNVQQYAEMLRRNNKSRVRIISQ